MLAHRAAILAALVPLHACGGEPFRWVPDRGPSLDDVDAGPVAIAPSRRDAAAAAVGTRADAAPTLDPARIGHDRDAFVPGPTTGRRAVAFAAHAAGGVGAFDPRSAAQLDVLPLAGAIEDLAWHDTWGRLVVVERDDVLDASRIHAVTWDPWPTIVGTSEPFEGTVRIWPMGSVLLVVSDALGARWHALNASLAPEGASALLQRPSGVVPLEASASATVIHPDHPAGRVHARTVQFDGASWSWTALGAVAAAPQGTRLLGGDAPRLASFFAAQLVVSSVWGTEDARMEVSAWPPGALMAGMRDDAASAVHVVIQPPGSPAVPAVLGSVAPGDARAVALELGGPVDASDWPCRCLELLDDGTRLLVATNAGVERVGVRNSWRGIEHERDGALAAAFRAPLALRPARPR